MRKIFKNKGREVTWAKAFILTGLWFLITSVIEAVLMIVIFGSHALLQSYFFNEYIDKDYLIYLFLSVWIIVIGHLMAMIIAGIFHKSWKIILLYAGIPVAIGILLFLWISSDIGNIVAA